MDSHNELIARICEGLTEEHSQLIRAVIEENTELRANLEKITKLHSKMSEEFEQECYSLKKRLETMSNMEQHYTEEVSTLQEQIHKLKSSDISKLQELEINKLKTKREELTTQLEASQSSERELQERLIQTQRQLEEQRQEHEGLSDQRSLMVSEDYLQLQSQVITLTETVEGLEEQLSVSEQSVKTLLNDKGLLQSLLLSKGEEIEQIRAEVSSYSNALEQAREENLEMRVQMENVQLEKADHREKGNSLFGELDDRRLKAEKSLVTIQAQCESAKQELTKEKQQHHRLKVQMTTLLQANNDSVSAERISRMQTLLSQLRTEKEALLAKVRQLEAEQKEQLTKLLEMQKKSGGGEGNDNKKDFTQFLTAVIQTKEHEITKLKEEIHQENIKLLSRDDKIIDCNRKISRLETELDKAQKKAMKQALQIDELRIKYEPEKESAAVKLGKTEKIPLETTDDKDDDKDTKFVLKESVLPNSNQSKTSPPDNPCHTGSHDTMKTGTAHGGLLKTATDSQVGDCSLEDSVFHKERQVKIQDSLVMISESGEKESACVKEENSKGKENIRLNKKGAKGVVHHKVKKVSSGQAVDSNQCKQQ